MAAARVAGQCGPCIVGRPPVLRLKRARVPSSAALTSDIPAVLKLCSVGSCFLFLTTRTKL